MIYIYILSLLHVLGISYIIYQIHFIKFFRGFLFFFGVATRATRPGPLHVQAHHAGHASRSLRKFKITPGIGECKEDLFGFCGFVPIALLSINSFYMVLTSSDNNNIYIMYAPSRGGSSRHWKVCPHLRTLSSDPAQPPGFAHPKSVCHGTGFPTTAGKCGHALH